MKKSLLIILVFISYTCFSGTYYSKDGENTYVYTDIGGTAGQTAITALTAADNLTIQANHTVNYDISGSPLSLNNLTLASNASVTFNNNVTVSTNLNLNGSAIVIGSGTSTLTAAVYESNANSNELSLDGMNLTIGTTLDTGNDVIINANSTITFPSILWRANSLDINNYGGEYPTVSLQDFSMNAPNSQTYIEGYVELNGDMTINDEFFVYGHVTQMANIQITTNSQNLRVAGNWDGGCDKTITWVAGTSSHFIVGGNANTVVLTNIQNGSTFMVKGDAYFCTNNFELRSGSIFAIGGCLILDGTNISVDASSNSLSINCDAACYDTASTSYTKTTQQNDTVQYWVDNTNGGSLEVSAQVDCQGDEETAAFAGWITLPAALPVDLVYFQTHAIEGKVLMEWKTMSEENSESFTILRSTDGVIYEPIYSETAAGTCACINIYNFTDENPPSGIVYYKLRQKDFDGKWKDYKINSVLVDANNHSITVVPNKIKNGRINITFSNPDKRNDLMILSAKGTEVFSTIVQGETSLLIDIELASGIYFVKNTIFGISTYEKIFVE